MWGIISCAGTGTGTLAIARPKVSNLKHLRVIRALSSLDRTYEVIVANAVVVRTAKLKTLPVDVIIRQLTCLAQGLGNPARGSGEAAGTRPSAVPIALPSPGSPAALGLGTWDWGDASSPRHGRESRCSVEPDFGFDM